MHFCKITNAEASIEKALIKKIIMGGGSFPGIVGVFAVLDIADDNVVFVFAQERRSESPPKCK